MPNRHNRFKPGTPEHRIVKLLDLQGTALISHDSKDADALDSLNTRLAQYVGESNDAKEVAEANKPIERKVAATSVAELGQLLLGSMYDAQYEAFKLEAGPARDRALDAANNGLLQAIHAVQPPSEQ